MRFNTLGMACTLALGAAPMLVPATATAAELRRINPEGLTKPQGYAQVVVGQGSRLVFVAGQAGIAPDGSIPEDLGEQSRLMFEKLRIALAAAGATPGDVVRITVYIVGLGAGTDPAPVYRAIREFFPADAKPASTIVGAPALALEGLKVEIEATALL